MREFSVPASFTIGEYDNVVAPVYSLERDDPKHVAIQRLVGDTWTDVTSAEVAAQVRATALGLIAKGVKAGDRVVLLSATRYEWPIFAAVLLTAAVGRLRPVCRASEFVALDKAAARG